MRTAPPNFEFNRGGTFNRPRDWAAFERLTRDLFARLLGDEDVDLNGRSGQPQAGIDISGIDRQSGKRVGIQCKGRADAIFTHTAALTEADLRAEVERARAFVPPIDSFILLTTGPNDARLKQAARELSVANTVEGLFTVEFHGWDWIEGRLDQHVDLAAQYGLVAVVHPGAAPAPPESPIALEIGARFEHAISLMNTGRDGDDRFTLQSLARSAGHRDWRRFERIMSGTADADEAELRTLCEALALNPGWLIDGKGMPFAVDTGTSFNRAEAVFDAIVAMQPQRVVFVRQRDGGDGDHDALIAVERDDVRWFVFRDTFPACDQVGGGGAHDLFELCRLMRRLYHLAPESLILCHGRHLDSPQFEQLFEGAVYPGSLLDPYRHDRWWEGFAHVRLDWIEGEGAHWDALRKAVVIVQHQLARARSSAERSRSWKDQLAWGRLRTKRPDDAEHGEPWP